MIKDNGEVAEETDEEKAAREEKARADLEARKKEYAEMDERQAKLKKKIEVGESEIRTPEEAKKIREAKEKLIAEIEKVARAYKINTWGEIIEIGERYDIFPKGLKKSQAQTFIVDHPEEYAKLWEAIKGDQKINEDDIPF